MYLLLSAPQNIYHFAETIESVPISGKILLNETSAFANISINQLKGVLSVIKNLKVKEEESQKSWFIETAKIFQEKSLRIFYMPFSTLEKIIKSKSFLKIPDPRFYLVGVSQIETGFAEFEKIKAQPKTSLRIYNLPRKSVDFIPDSKTQLLKNFKFDAIALAHKNAPIKVLNSSFRNPGTSPRKSEIGDQLKNETKRGAENVNSKAQKDRFYGC